MTINDKCIRFLKAKYEYYILSEPTLSDSAFDKLELELRNSGDEIALEVVDMVDFPPVEDIKKLGFDIEKIAPLRKVLKDESYYPHWTLMQSIAKLQVNDEENIPLGDVEKFISKRRDVKSYECSCKYDGNSMSLMYEDGYLVKALTRGHGYEGKDRTKKMRVITPNRISLKGKIEIRGEVIIKKSVWKDKYYTDLKISNERNFVGGALNKQDFIIDEITDLVFVAYSLVSIDENGKAEYIDKTMKVLEDEGFNKIHKPFLQTIRSVSDFKQMYFDFKEYRKNCEYLLDGIVIKYPENVRMDMKSKTKYPAWSLAIKFESVFAETVLESYEWSQGKNNEFTPIAILTEVELGGCMNRRASCHNLAFIIKHGVFPGSVISIRKAGEIINQVVSVVKKSPDHDMYMKQFTDFLENQNQK